MASGTVSEDRVIFSARVEIRAEMSAVFALVSDLRQKAPLNPNIQVIRIELEGGEPLRVGSVFYHRFRKKGKVFAYRTECIAMDAPRLFVIRSKTNPPFEVKAMLEPTLEGCRLTQEETLEVTPEMLDAFEPKSETARSLREGFTLLSRIPGLRQLPAEWRAQQRERVARQLTKELETWLEAIKAHLETHR